MKGALIELFTQLLVADALESSAPVDLPDDSRSFYREAAADNIANEVPLEAVVIRDYAQIAVTRAMIRLLVKEHKGQPLATSNFQFRPASQGAGHVVVQFRSGEQIERYCFDLQPDEWWWTNASVSTPWLPLAQLTFLARKKATELPARMDMRVAAAAIAMTVWQEGVNAGNFILINVAALGWAMRERLVVHELNREVIDYITDLSLASVPPEPPRLLQNHWLIEARRPQDGGRLFGDTASLGAYRVDDTFFLIGLLYPDGARVCRWRPRWLGEDLGGSVELDASSIVEDVDAHREWAQEAAKFAVIVGIVLDVPQGPVESKDEGPQIAGRRHGKAVAGRPWAVRYLSLTKQARRQQQLDRHESVQPAVPSDGRTSVRQRIRSALRRVACGPGGKSREWRVVRSYEAVRWHGPKPTRVVVTK